MKDGDDLESLLKRASEAVAAAKVPDDLRAAAFGKAFDRIAGSSGKDASGGGETAAGGGGAVGAAELGTIKNFLKVKAPADDVERVTSLAYFLTQGKETPTYKAGDLSKARVDAALASFNVSRAISNAQRARYMTTAGKRGTLQLTSVGEAVVEAMPDRDAVKEAKAKTPRRRRKSTSKRANRRKGSAKKAAARK